MVPRIRTRRQGSGQASAKHFQQCVEFLPPCNRGLGPLAPSRLPGGPPLPLPPPCSGSSVAKLLEGLRLLSGISRLTEFGRIPVTVITLPGRTDGVLGRSRGDFGSVLLVA